MKTAWGSWVRTPRDAGRPSAEVRTVRALARHTLVFWAWSAAFLTLWSLATPLWSAPDSVAHDIRAYGAAHGNLSPAPPRGEQALGTLGVDRVPQGLMVSAQTAACYAFQPEVSAGCMAPVGPSEELVPFANPAGRYIPTYYAVTGLPTLVVPLDLALPSARGAAVLISSLFLGLALAAARTMRRPAVAMTGVVVGCSPMVLYLGGVVNPNSLEVTAMAAVGACSLAALLRPSSPISDVLLRLALAVRRRAVHRPDDLAGLARPVAGGAPRRLRWDPRPSARRPQDAGVDRAADPGQPGELCLDVQLGRLAVGHAGRDAGLGVGRVGVVRRPDRQRAQRGGRRVRVARHLALPRDYTFYVVGAVFLVGVLSTVVDRRRLAGLVALLAAAYLVPIAIQAAQWNSVGPVWQGRYTLPLLLLVPVTVAMVASERADRAFAQQGGAARRPGDGTAGLRARARLLRPAAPQRRRRLRWCLRRWVGAAAHGRGAVPALRRARRGDLGGAEPRPRARRGRGPGTPVGPVAGPDLAGAEAGRPVTG